MRKAVPFFIILFVTSAVYYAVWSGGFLRDDFPVITENPWITSPGYIPDIFTSSLWAFYQGDFITGTSNYYRPVMHLLLMGSHTLFGTEPAGYHGVNLAFHILNAFLVFLIASSLLGSKEKNDINRPLLLPLAASLLFALHPANAEPVVWVAAIGELSFTFFFMAAFYLFILSGQGRSVVLYVFSICVYFVALFSKETATVLAPLFALYGIAEGRPLIQAVKRGAPYLAAAGVFVLIRSAIVGSLSAEHAMSGFQYILSVLTLTAQYAEKLVFPFGIKLYYPFHPPTSFQDIVSHGLAVLFLLASSVAFWVWKSSSRRTIVFFLLWMMMALSPAILMVKYIQGEWVFASRYLYFSTAGLSILAAFGLNRLASGRPVKAATAVPVLIVLVLFAFESARASRFWTDEFSFWQKAVIDAPSSPTTHASLGVAYAQKKMYQEAIREYEATIKIAPDSAGVYSNLGVAYYSVNETGKAVQMFEKALSFAKDENSAASLNARVGIIYLEKGLPEKAAFHLEKAIRAGMNDSNMYNFLGIAYASVGQYDKAYTAFSEALRIDPRNSRALQNLKKLKEGGAGAGGN
ncbi:MAG: tetratricopeptide repeat protein [Deltaproteobacteria bacterium]|nr:tetratricopeptide repeat protein [Deltaproteobacteria bacterium]